MALCGLILQKAAFAFHILMLYVKLWLMARWNTIVCCSAVNYFLEGFLSGGTASLDLSLWRIRLQLNVKAAPAINPGSRFQVRGLRAQITAARAPQQPLNKAALGIICVDYWEERPQPQLNLYSTIWHLDESWIFPTALAPWTEVWCSAHSTRWSGWRPGWGYNLIWSQWRG